MSGWRIAAAGAAIAGYALLSHALMLHAAERPWAVAVIFGPLVLAVAAVGWQRRQGWLLAACGAGVAVLAWVVAAGGVGDIDRMYVLQHVGFHLALALAFGATLRAGATPLITALALSLHHRFTPEMRAYTGWLTRVWTLYFAAMAVFSVVLYLAAPWPWWSLYANVLTPAAAALLFVGEHVQRYRRHPEFERVSIRSVIQAYRRAGAADGASRP